MLIKPNKLTANLEYLRENVSFSQEERINLVKIPQRSTPSRSWCKSDSLLAGGVSHVVSHDAILAE